MPFARQFDQILYPKQIIHRSPSPLREPPQSPTLPQDGGHMDPDFWHTRWQAKRIGFHETNANARLVAQFHALSLPPGGRIFVPLCGKTRDIAWLLSRGHAVVGVELSEIAIQQLFDDLGTAPTITDAGPLRRYSAQNLDIYMGDFFDLTPAIIGPVDAVYDRAALVALPADMRTRYATRVTHITRGAPQLVICFNYDQTLTDGPPFSIDQGELRRLYGPQRELELLETGPVPGGFKGGQIPATETAWLLR
jgi:thiopurine S-methyltransferase